MSSINKIKTEDGYTLTGVVMVFLVLSVLGASILTLTFHTLKISSTERLNQSAFYIAETGITLMSAEFEHMILQAYETTNTRDGFYNRIGSSLSTHTIYSDFEETFNENPVAEVRVEAIDHTNGIYKITSVGTIAEETRILERVLTVEWIPKSNELDFADMALLVSGSINLPNGRINGDIGTISTEPNSITASGGALVNGTIYVPKGHEHDAVDKPSWMSSVPSATGADMASSLPALPEFPTVPTPPLANEGTFIAQGGTNRIIDLTPSSLSFHEIRVLNDRTVEINIGNSDRVLVVDKLNLYNGHLRIIGSGTLTIYINEIFNMGGSASSINKNGDTNQLNIFVKGSEEISLTGGQMIFGSIYTESGNIRLDNGGGLQGNIFTGGNRITVSGGTWATSPLILAPNAIFEHTNGTVKGIIIANSYNMTGGAILDYSGMDFTEGPISIEGIRSDSTDENESPIRITKSPIIEK